MRILYGVQGTGNGHLTRARVMAAALSAAGVEVQFLFSGRPVEQFFDMAPFGDWWWHRGLTFVSRNGRVDRLRTLARAVDLPVFVGDLQRLDLSGFDLVLSDFEPVTAWAAYLQRKPLVGLGHQQAFRYAIPKCPGGCLARLLLRGYAPASVGLGMHWHHFGHPILPPLVEPLPEVAVEPRRILIYLPFESLGMIQELLASFPEWDFQVFHGEVKTSYRQGHVHYHPLSRQRFQSTLASATGVICNSGFELISEALQAGKKILTKPLGGQWEQCCNAHALAQLGWGEVMDSLDPGQVAVWLCRTPWVRIEYPDVAAAITAWLLRGDWRLDPQWIQSLWQQTRIVLGDQEG